MNELLHKAPRETGSTVWMPVIRSGNLVYPISTCLEKTIAKSASSPLEKTIAYGVVSECDAGHQLAREEPSALSHAPQNRKVSGTVSAGNLA